MLTLEELKEALPVQMRAAADVQLLGKVNGASNDPEFAQIVRDNFVSYSTVLNDGRYKVEDYLNAVAYVSFKLMGYTNKDSYGRAFPQRMAKLHARGATEKDISAYVANYNKNKLVNAIREQTLIPVWVLNQDAYQNAIQVQIELMSTAQSEKVRTEAANSLLTHLKRPETKKVEIDLGVRQDNGLEALKDMMAQLAEQQLNLIGSGTSTREIAHQKLIKPMETDLEGQAEEI